jgi:hypothetical protein
MSGCGRRWVDRPLRLSALAVRSLVFPRAPALSGAFLFFFFFLKRKEKKGQGELQMAGCRLEHSAQLGQTELHLVLDISATPGEQLAMIPIHLGIGGVAEALEALLKETARSTRVTEDARARDLEMLKRDMPPLVSLVLYLCCQSAEITDQRGANRLPARPQPVKTKRGLRFFPPDRPTQWQVGYRLGAALSRAVSERGAPSSGGTQRAHVRTSAEPIGIHFGSGHGTSRKPERWCSSGCLRSR